MATDKPATDRIQRVEFQSRIFNAAKHYTIVLPAGRDANSELPVLYILHGRGRNDQSLLDSPACRERLLNLPFAIVLPNGEDGWYLDSPIRPSARYRELLDETIHDAESRFRLCQDPTHRAIAGWSMGGYGCIRYAEAHPKSFAFVASIMGLLDFPRSGLPTGQTYNVPERTFGDDEKAWPALNPLNAAEKLRGSKLLIITADDAFDRTMNQNFHSRLNDLNIAHEWKSLPGEHHFEVVERALPLVLEGAARVVATSANDAASILRVDRVWNAAPYNSFTDMVRFNDRFILAFREGVSHGVPKQHRPGGALRILESADGISWKSAALIKPTSPDEDLRDAKLSITPDGKLMLTGAAAFKSATSDRQSKVWFSADGRTWTNEQNIGERNDWLWGTTWHKGDVYSVAYGPTSSQGENRDQRFTRLYRGKSGTDFVPYVTKLSASSKLTGGGETALLFRSDGTAVALSRRDSGNLESLIGVSAGDFTNWKWHVIPDRIGGPELIELPDGRIIAASRRTVNKESSTCLFWLDPAAGTLTHFLTLPSGGDTSYAGMVWHNDKLWVSYYSSHEKRASIYVAQVRIPPLPSAATRD